MHDAWRCTAPVKWARTRADPLGLHLPPTQTSSTFSLRPSVCGTDGAVERSRGNLRLTVTEAKGEPDLSLLSTSETRSAQTHLTQQEMALKNSRASSMRACFCVFESTRALTDVLTDKLYITWPLHSTHQSRETECVEER